MLFTSFQFLLVFLPVTLAGLWIAVRLGDPRISLGWLILVSVVFYGWTNYFELAIFGISMLVNYTAGRHLSRTPHRSGHDRALLTTAIVFNLGLLAWFKYRLFVLGIVTGQPPTTALIIPLAISFFTFHQVSFVVDCYRGAIRALRFERYALYIAFFPHLIAGPIIRYNEFSRQIDGTRWGRPTAPMFCAGISLLIIGLAKKTLLADNIAHYIDPLFLAAEGGNFLRTEEAWIAALGYTLQIYFDFSGYSDMAVGLAAMMGFRFPLNFFSPYKSLSIIDFWRRWHISLSRFLRDYLYIPLGGNRRGPLRQNLNAIITMTLGGLWHGAGWTFIAWGLFHGLLLSVNYQFRQMTGGMNKVVRWRRAATALSWLLTILAVIVGWVLFRSADMDSTVRVLLSMSGMGGAASGVPVDAAIQPGLWHREIHALLMVGAAIALLAPNTAQLMVRYRIIEYPSDGKSSIFTRRRSLWTFRPSWVWAILLALCLGFFVRQNVSVAPAQFIYFRF